MKKDHQEKVVEEKQEESSFLYWNVLLIAIYHGQLEIVQYLMEDVRINIRAAIMITDTPNEREVLDERRGTTALELALDQKEKNGYEVFEYLWSEHETLWTQTHFEFISQKISQLHNAPLMKFLYQQHTTHTIFRYMKPLDRVSLITKLVNDESVIGQEVSEIMKEQPYAPAVLYILAGGYPNHPL